MDQWCCFAIQSSPLHGDPSSSGSLSRHLRPCYRICHRYVSRWSPMTRSESMIRVGSIQTCNICITIDEAFGVVENWLYRTQSILTVCRGRKSGRVEPTLLGASTRHERWRGWLGKVGSCQSRHGTSIRRRVIWAILRLPRDIPEGSIHLWLRWPMHDNRPAWGRP